MMYYNNNHLYFQSKCQCLVILFITFLVLVICLHSTNMVDSTSEESIRTEEKKIKSIENKEKWTWNSTLAELTVHLYSFLLSYI